MSVNLSVNKNNYFSIRFRIHKQLLPFFHKIAINQSLSTKSKRLARFKANKIYYQYQEILNTVSIISPVQTQELVNKFISTNLNQTKPIIFTIDETKYKSLDNTLTIALALEKFKIWYKQQDITDKQYLLTMNKLENMILLYFGFDTYLEEITLERMGEFKEFLSTFPNINKKVYKHLSFKEIYKLKNIPKDDIIGLNTQIKYLKILKQFFGFLIKANLLSYNPCLLLNLPYKMIQNREPFDNNDIQKLFNIFETLDNRKYIYYILAYTGMRPSELWKCSIAVSEDNIIYFDLRNKDLKLKTSSSYRIIPLHKELLRMNIDKKLPSLQLEFRQSILSKYFNTSIKPRVSSSRNKIMYSFRHTVATELKRAEVNMDMVSELLGHSYESSSITKDVYTSGYRLNQLQTAINNLVFQ